MTIEIKAETGQVSEEKELVDVLQQLQSFPPGDVDQGPVLLTDGQSFAGFPPTISEALKMMLRRKRNGLSVSTFRISLIPDEK